MKNKFDVRIDDNNDIVFEVNVEGNDLLRAPLLNKGSAFTKKERNDFDLNGLLPPHVLTLDQQLEKTHKRYRSLGRTLEKCDSCTDLDRDQCESLQKEMDMARYNFLRALQDRNELLFYAFANRYMDEVVPIIYTPTVGAAVQRYSRDSVRFRGVFLSPFNIDIVESVFHHIPYHKPTIAVVTDNQGILGLGDQGVGGIDIPIGKLALYVMGAGIPPWETVPITLDVGTANETDLKDPYYLGYKAGRLRGEEYEAFLDKFVKGIKSKFPNILIQWEDFSRQNAFNNLDKYRNEVLSFNDDIQGTGAMAYAGTLSALKSFDGPLSEQQFIVYGAGSGGIGIARQISAGLQLNFKLTPEQANARIAILDSKGLVTDDRDVDEYKKSFVLTRNDIGGWSVEDSSKISLLETVTNFGCTVLFGTSGQGGHFTDDVIKAMAANTEHPVIFPLSNPTSLIEAEPQKIYRLTDGKAIVATGSPFEPFQFEGKTVTIGQGNNVFIFPGIGLGAILSKASYISDAVFTEAAAALAESTSDELISKGTVFPPISEIRGISASIAAAVSRQISKEQGTEELDLETIKKMMWKPGYPKMIRTDLR